MLDITLIRQKSQWVKEQLARLFVEDAETTIDLILQLDAKRREIRTETEHLQGIRNTLNKANGRLRGNKQLDEAVKATIALNVAKAIEAGHFEYAVDLIQGNTEAKTDQAVELTTAFNTLTEALRELGNRIDEGFHEAKQVEAELQEHMLMIPNLPHESIPVSPNEADNIPWPPEGAFFEFDFVPKPHWDLGPELGIIDFERGVKLSGTRFYLLKGWGARLQRALIQFFLDQARQNGYREVYVPYLVQEDMLVGSAQFPKFRDNVYHDSEADLYLLPTAEVAITNIHRDEILDEADLPLYYVSHSPCFRREKASAGRDVRGIKRVHQFEKVEMYKFATPETSYAELETMTENAADICRALKIPFRRLEIVTGDLGFSAAKKYDLEMWAPGCQEWLEVSSCSNTESFQSRRAMIRYRPEGSKKTGFVHTLNGSALALPRVIIAIIENYQQADGSVIIPEAIRPYLDNAEIIPARSLERDGKYR